MKKRRDSLFGGVVFYIIIGLLVSITFLSQKIPITPTGIAVGTLSFAQGGSAGISLTNATIDFGSGYVNGSCSLGYAVLDSSNISATCWVNTSAFLQNGSFHRLENTGTVPLQINATANKHDAEEFFCGTQGGCTYSSAAKISLKTFNAENSSCTVGTLDASQTLLSDSGNSTIELCKVFKFDNNSNLLNIGIRMQVPIDVQPNTKTLLITYEAIPA